MSDENTFILGIETRLGTHHTGTLKKTLNQMKQGTVLRKGNNAHENTTSSDKSGIRCDFVQCFSTRERTIRGDHYRNRKLFDCYLFDGTLQFFLKHIHLKQPLATSSSRTSRSRTSVVRFARVSRIRVSRLSGILQPSTSIEP